VIENRRGFLSHFSYAPRPELLDALGDEWLTDTLAYKQHPGCAYLQPAVEAVLRLQAENGFEAGDVGRIDVRAGWLTTTMEKLGAGEPLTSVRVNFSVALSCAAALTAGRLTHDELTPDWLSEHDDELRDLATRVFLEHDWDLTAKTLAGVGGSIRDIPVRRLPDIRRRMRATGMDEAELSIGELREGARRIGVRGLMRRDSAAVANGGAPNGGDFRMTFPCHVTIYLRHGGALETDGREYGGSHHPVEEQQQVVDQKFATVRDAAEIPKAWRRRPEPAPVATS
jgi:hypothetical protein